MVQGPRGDESGAELSRETVWLRITFSHVRRVLHRGQSRQKTGAEGGWAGVGSGSGEEVAWAEESGQSTALTRRGLSVVMLSWHCTRKGQERQWLMRAAYKSRKDPSRSGRRSWR